MSLRTMIRRINFHHFIVVEIQDYTTVGHIYCKQKEIKYLKVGYYVKY